MPQVAKDGKEELNHQEIEIIQDLQKAGFAVIVWTPSELGDYSSDDMEDNSISYGWGLLDKQPEDEDED